ncbi:wolframin-like [Mercenaria mercenaria]|uniref:wolframin-like n=1 Tax=Mercenaria mercenaria TaxID=6596 RepID=UPI00234EF8FD|nr:wolframin-like [Mercenaria mercenaria]
MATAVSSETTSKKESEAADVSPEWLEKAKNGEEEFQLKLGVHYLTLADSSIESEENGKLAIHWLVAASKQGNEKATEKLKECLETKTGLTDENTEEVKWCVTTSSLEKKIRYAARNMFHSINTAQKEVLSPDEYAEAIKKLTGGKEQKLLLAAGKKIGENISENEFVKILSRKVQGTMTLTSTERSAAYDAASPVEKLLKFPKETCMILGDQALEFASKDGLNMVMSCVPTDQIYFLTLFFLYGFLTPKFLLEVVPLVIFYISYATIIITTLQMFYKKKKLKEASALAEMLKQYDVGVDVNQTQSQYSWNSLTPYLVYFASIPLVVASFSLADKTYIPCSELCVLNSVICGICFLAISDSHDLVTLLALFCGFLAGLPVFLHNFPEIPVITPVIHFVSGSFLTVDLFGGLKLNIGIPSICYSIIPVFFIQMAVRNSFQGMYRVFVPHLVCYFWFNLVTSMYPFTTWIGLGRATVGYVMLPLLIPLSVFIFFIGMIYLFVRLAASDMFGKVVITLLLGCIPLLLTQTKKLFGGKLDKKFGFLKKIVMVVFAVLAIVPLIFVRFPTVSDTPVAPLTVDDFTSVCNVEGPEGMELTMNCNHLKGSKITWQGKIAGSKVTGVNNEVVTMLHVFPSFIADPLRCVYGKSYGDCSAEGMSEQEVEYCKLMTSLGHKCGLEEHDKFTYSFDVQFAEGLLSGTLDAGTGFKQFYLNLVEGDEVEIKGTIVDALSRPLKLKLKEIKCLNRELELENVVEEEVEDLYYQLFEQSLQVAFNFFWYPLAEYVPPSHTGETVLD